MRMASSSGSSVFYDLLVEEYRKKPKNVDVVAQKRQSFQSLVFRAHNELKLNRFSDAKRSYFYIIELLGNDPYPDELNLSLDIYYFLKCCFCYSCLMDMSRTDMKWDQIATNLVKELSEKYSYKLFPRFLQVLLCFHKKDWVMALQWCKSVESHSESCEEHVEEHRLSVTSKTVLPNKLQILAEVETYEEKCFFNYWAELAKNRLAKSKNKKYDFLFKEVSVVIKLLSMETPFSESDLQNIFRQEVIPLWCTSKDAFNYNLDQNGINQCGDCMKEKIKSFAIREISVQESNINFEKFLVKLVEALTKIYKCSFIESIEGCVLSKIEEIEDIVTRDTGVKGIENVGSKDKLIIAQTQTDTLKNGNRSVQTEAIKTKSVEVQVESDMQLINTMLDIKNKLLINQEKKDDTIAKLNRKICELNEKLLKDNNKRRSVEEDYQKKFAKQEIELKKLRAQLEESDRLRKQEHEKNLSLQKLLVEQISDKFNTLKNICKAFEKKSSFMVTYLKEILQFLSPNSIPSETVVQQNIDIWESHLKRIKGDLDQLNSFYKKVRVDMINSEKFNLTWPDIPEFPTDEDNIIFVSFRPAIKNIVDIEGKLFNKPNVSSQAPVPPYCQVAQNNPYTMPRPQYSIQSSSYFIGPRLVYPGLPSSMPVGTSNPVLPQQRPIFTKQKQPSHGINADLWQNPNIRPSNSNECLRSIEKDVKVTEAVVSTKPHVKLVTASAKANSENRNKKYQEKEKIIFEYVIENCPNATEDEVTLALLQVVDDNKGTLSKLSKDKIVAEVKTVLRMKKQLAWVTPKSPHVDWKNDHSEQNCSICFEEFSLKETYNLPCQHEFHKECIKKWLKASSVCPICRIHSVIDEEFPPLH